MVAQHGVELVWERGNMGFLSGLFGGKETTTPASGLEALTPAYRNLYNSVTGNLSSNIGNINASMFRPQDLSVGEQGAIGQINQGFTPTQDSLSSDIGMLMNPYQQYVTNDINRQANSGFSVLKQNADAMGQFGSNRQQLGANDIEQTRLNTIGNANRIGYDTALSSLLNNIIPQRRLDAASQLGIGDFIRNLSLQQQQAPLQSMQAQAGLLGAINPIAQGQPQQTFKTGGGLSGMLGGIGQLGGLASGVGGISSYLGGTGLASSLGAAGGLSSIGGALSSLGGLMSFSDARLKENVVFKENYNGHNIYQFNYIGNPQLHSGVIAQEVELIDPESVMYVRGVRMVDYNRIGVEFA